MVGMIKLATNRARLTIETKFDLIGRQAISSHIAAYTKRKGCRGQGSARSTTSSKAWTNKQRYRLQWCYF